MCSLKPPRHISTPPEVEVRRMVRPGLHTSDALGGPLPLGQTHTILERYRYTAHFLDESD
jgi:hypothetical protein